MFYSIFDCLKPVPRDHSGEKLRVLNMFIIARKKHG